ncbi:hypothetical protein EJV46_08930 [Roseococcus sp. SYP-B2431]|uniref:hypothetical protein n=1 Tax=Roseococcus sp. SYP-B2431 TaxID=2496640 RepID=UPI00103D983F|nr:hypothetical protein [Roseococcus sp. SYP-B2431]TCH98688.1 hypothetical protein EJV46_08930 [Roseococcus sp. SYP-B2431]
MLADPIRLAFRPPGRLDVPEPPDGGPALGPDEALPIPGEITFDDVLQGLNPLHHLPGVGIAYRAVTGADIHPAMRVLGAGILGGPLGMALAGVASAVEMTMPGARLRAALNGEPDPLPAARPATAGVAAQDVAGAYRRWAELASPARTMAALAEATRLPGPATQSTDRRTDQAPAG